MKFTKYRVTSPSWSMDIAARRLIALSIWPLLALGFGIASVAEGAQLGIYEFTGTSTGDNQLNAVTAQPAGGNFSTFTRTNVAWATAANVFNSNGWNATTSVIDTAEYVEFSFTVNPGYSATISDLSFFQQASNTLADEFEVRYSLDGFSSFLSRGSDTALISPGATEAWDFTDVPLTAGQSIGFRWYVYGDTQADGAGVPSSAGTFRLDNVQLNGTLTPIGGPDNDTVITADSLSYNFGRVMTNQSRDILIDKVGSEATTATLSYAGGLSGSGSEAFVAGTVADQASSVNLGSTTGILSGAQITINNDATTSAAPGQGSDDPNDVVDIAATVVANRFVNSGRNNTGVDADINPALNDFGNIIVGQARTQNISLTTSNSPTNTATAEDDDHLTRITIPASVTTTNVGTVLATTSIADSVADLVNDGGDVVTRSMTVSPTTTGSFAANGGNYTRFSTMGEGLTGEAGDIHSRIYYQFTGLTSANASFAASDDNDLTINLGNFTQGTGTQNPGFGFDLYNLLTTAGFTAGLDLTGFLAGLGDSEVLISLLNSVNNLSEGLSTNVTGTAAIDTNTSPGLLSRVFTLQLRDDENIAGFQAQTLDLTLEANIVAIPEPSSLVLVAMGAVALLRRRRRCS